MEMLNIVFVFAIQLMVFRAGDCYEIAITLPPKTEYKPGEDVSIRCHGTSTAEEDLTVYFIKVGYHIPGYNGADTFSGEDNEGYPIILATFDNIDSAVQRAVSNRYTADGSHSDTEFDYTYTITGLTLEDYGNYSCGAEVGNKEMSPAANAQVKVLGPIEKMAILYLPNGQNRTTLKSNLERDNPDNKTTWVTDAEAEPGELACMIQYTTSPPTEWSVTLYDPHTEETTDVKDLFRDVFPDATVTTQDGPLISVTEDLYFLSPAPTPNDERFGYKDSGKTLKLTSKVRGYEEVKEFSTVLDIQYPPMEVLCAPENSPPQAPVGTENFKLLCYARGNPEPTLTWKANGEALRSGITIQKVNKGPYIVSVLTIDEVNQTDFTSYSFDATNSLGTKTLTPWAIEEGTKVLQAPDVDAEGYPWYLPINDDDDDGEEKDPSKASAMSTSGTLLVVLVVSLFLY